MSRIFWIKGFLSFYHLNTNEIRNTIYGILTTKMGGNHIDNFKEL